MSPVIRSSSLVLLTFAGSAVAVPATEPTKEQAEFFESKIRPILAESCYKCHSLEQGKAKGGLTLDTKGGWEKGGENGDTIIPGKPEESLLIKAIGYLDADLQMPPKGEKLTDAQIALLTEWVKMGAPDPRKEAKNVSAKLTGLTDQARHHWAYQPVVKPAVPLVKNANWARTPVDAFIMQKLEEKGMVPAPDATKEALLRRATYDLIGLPPTVQEVQAFLADNSPKAFEKVIDRLLSSPHYGERWGRFWLDTARYADTIGGERNANALRGNDYRYAYAWTYRDWVIEAVNKDLPYDQFVLQQLAADKIKDNKQENLAALGFLTVGERFRNVNDIINDRIDAVSKGFLGMTVSCARCHDHMFDPIPTSDYYALHGVFASTIEPKDKPQIAAATADDVTDYKTKLAAAEKESRDQYYKFVGKVQDEFFKKVGDYLLVLRFGGKKQMAGNTAEALKERQAILNRANLDREIVQSLARLGRRDDEVFTVFRQFANLEKDEFETKGPEILVELTSEKGRKRVNPLVAQAFAGTSPKSIEEVSAIYTKLFGELEGQRKAYLAACISADEKALAAIPAEQKAIFRFPLDLQPSNQINTQWLRDFAQGLGNQLSRRSDLSPIFSKLNELELTHPGAPARAMLVADASKPKDSPIFIRGQAEAKGEVIPRRFLEVLSPDRKPLPFKEGSGRLELAQSIATKANPLTARVLVNRVWMHHFGEGFVRTPDDLGTQSEAPSHPELLDYLSSYFMDQGWSQKKLHKLIMLSRVYQESTKTNAKFEQMDPDNRYLWRANIRRLDFEAMRDSLLVFSGNLDGTLGGKPINLTDEPYSFRRSVYGYIDRGNLPELMQSFDFSDPDMPNSKRTTTIVPQQALFLMNSPMAVDVARKIVARPEIANAADDLGRVIALYRVVFQRVPTPQEIQLAYQFLGVDAKEQPQMAPTTALMAKMDRQKQKQKQQKNGRRAGLDPIKNEGELVERRPLTAWEIYTQALLFSNEAAYVN